MLTHTPRYTVITPLYNKEESITRTIQSVLKQTEQDFELLIIDDGSTDASAERVADIADPRIRLIHQENSGVSAARNCGIRNAAGQYLCFLDADDLWESDFLAEVGMLYARFPEAAVVCPSYQVCYDNDRVIHPVWRSVDPDQPSLVNDFFEMATAPFWVMNCSCFSVKREALAAMDHWFPEGESVYEDFDFFLRLGTQYRIAHSNRVCASYRRITAQNARTQHRHRVIYSKSYMNTLRQLLLEPQYSPQQKKWIKQIHDRRMVPYIFSLLLCRKRTDARQVLKGWHPDPPYTAYRYALKIAACLPYCAIEFVQNLRYRMF